MKRLLRPILVVIMLAGCANPAKYGHEPYVPEWAKPNPVSSANFNKKQYEADQALIRKLVIIVATWLAPIKR